MTEHATADGAVAVQIPPAPATGGPPAGVAAHNHQRALRFLQISERLDALSEEERTLKEERAKLEEEMFREIEETGVTNFRLTYGGQPVTLFVRKEIRASSLDHAAVVRWFNANGLSSKVQVPAASLSSLVKEYVKRADDAGADALDTLPEGLRGAVSVYTQVNIRSRRGK